MCNVVMGRPVCRHGGPRDRHLLLSLPDQTAAGNGASRYPTGLASVDRVLTEHLDSRFRKYIVEWIRDRWRQGWV